MVSISVPAAILGAGALSAGVSAFGASQAAGAQQDAANTAAQTQMNMYNQTRSDLMPFFQGGQSAFSNLTNLLGQGGPQASQNMLEGLQNYPGYQFALDQGTQALDRSAAARGTLLSGGQLKDLTAYGQGMGSQLFGNYFNQNLQASQLGENAAAQTGNAGGAAASGAASSQLAGGTAAASGISGIANSIGGPNGVIQSALQAYQVQNGGGGSAFPNSPTSNTTPYATYTGYNPNAGYTIQPQL